MKRVLLLAAVASIAIGVPALAGAAGIGDTKGPDCRDIVNGSGTYGFTGVDQVSVVVDLAAPACKSTVYTVTASTLAGPVQLDQVGQSSDGMSLFFQTTVDHTTNSSVCVSATTSTGGGSHVVDSAPDTGCVAMPYLGSPGFGNFS